MRCFHLLTTVLILACCAFSQDRVFVNLERLVSFHPAWQLAQRIESERTPIPISWVSLVQLPTDVPLSLTLPSPEPFLEWSEKQKRAWTSEVDSIRQFPIERWQWQLQLALPVMPFVDPVARWKFIVQEREKQAAERVRLNLRLAFSDLLPPEEKVALEERLRELDLALEPPPKTIPLPLLPLPTPPRLNLSPPSELTNPQEIFALVAPPPSPPQIRFPFQVADESDKVSPKLLDKNIGSVLRSIAWNMARNFVLAYAQNRKWNVSFKPREGLTDATDEVLTAWRLWLERTKPKE